jgi:hypothetical protein
VYSGATRQARRTGRGADLNWTPNSAKQTPLEIAAALDTGREALVGWLRDQGAGSAGR